MSDFLTVVACLRAKAGEHGHLREELQRLVAPTRAEVGCVTYELHGSKSEPGFFMFYEIWRSAEDLDAHFKTPHMVAISKLLPDLLKEPMDLTKWIKL